MKLVATVEKIERIYSGKAGKCACGCSGKYTEKKDKKKFASMFKKVLAFVESGKAEEIEVTQTYTSITVEGRWYILYFVEA